MKPNFLFTVWSPDTVAECLEGVTDSLYRRLWELTEEVPASMDAETREWMCADDGWSERCLAKVWKRLTPEEQKVLNHLAAEEEKK